MKHQVLISLTSCLLFVSCLGQNESPKSGSLEESAKSYQNSAAPSRQETTKEDSKRRFDSISGSSGFHSFGKRGEVTEEGEDIIDSKRKFDRISSMSGFGGLGKRGDAGALLGNPGDEADQKTNGLDKRRFDSISGASGFSSFGKRRFDSISGKSSFRDFGKRTSEYPDDVDVSQLDKRRFDSISGSSRFGEFGKRGVSANENGASPELSTQSELMSLPAAYWLPNAENARHEESRVHDVASPDTEMSEPSNSINVDKKPYDRISGSAFSDFGKRPFDRISSSAFSDFGKRPFDRISSSAFSDFGKRPYDRISNSAFSDFGKRPFDRISNSAFSDFGKRPFDRISSSAFSDFGKRPYDRISSSAFSDFGKRPYDRISNSAFSDFGKRPFDRISNSAFSDFGKRPFDRISNSAFSDFGKRPFDRISNSAFSDFGKRPYDRISNSAFSDFGKRPFDRISSSAFSDFGKRPFDRISSSAFSGFGKRPFDRISSSGFTSFGKKSMTGSDVESDQETTDIADDKSDIDLNGGADEYSGQIKAEDKRRLDSISGSSAFGGFGKREAADVGKRRWDRLDNGSAFQGFGKRGGSDDVINAKSKWTKSSSDVDLNGAGKNKSRDERSAGQMPDGFAQNNDAKDETRVHSRGKRDLKTESSAPQTRSETSKVKRDVNGVGMGPGRGNGIDTSDNEYNEPLSYESDGSYWRNHPIFTDALAHDEENTEDINDEKRRFDAISGASDFGGFGKRRFDRIGSGLHGFGKRRFDKISADSGFGGFGKRRYDKIGSMSSFGDFGKRRFDSIAGGSGFNGFGKRRFDRISNAFSSFGKRRFDRIDRGSAFSRFGKRNVLEDDIKKRRFDAIDRKSSFRMFGKRNLISQPLSLEFEKDKPFSLDADENLLEWAPKDDSVDDLFSGTSTDGIDYLLSKRRFDPIDQLSTFRRFGRHAYSPLQFSPDSDSLGKDSSGDVNAEKNRQFLADVFELLNKLLSVPRARLYH